MVVVACFEGMFVEELAAAEDGAGLGDEAADLPLLRAKLPKPHAEAAVFS